MISMLKTHPLQCWTFSLCVFCLSLCSVLFCFSYQCGFVCLSSAFVVSNDKFYFLFASVFVSVSLLLFVTLCQSKYLTVMWTYSQSSFIDEITNLMKLKI